MHELRVLFDRIGDAVTVRLVPGWRGGAGKAVPFTAALSEEEYEDLRWYLEDYLDLPDGGAVVRAHRVEREIGAWGRRLYTALFGEGDPPEVLRELLAASPPRLLTVATDDGALLRLPWELLSDGAGPLSRRGVTVRRQLERAAAPQAFRASTPLRLLLIVSRPADLGFLDPRLTTRGMLDALAPLGDGVAVDFCRPPTLPRMEEMLAEAARLGEPYHVVHFDGHGTFLPEIGLGALCFEKPGDPAAGTDYVRADRLGDVLAAHSLPVVLLEACRTSQISRVSAFRSVAPRLIEAGVGSVLAMGYAVHVEATRVLFKRFYGELVEGRTIGQALESGRGALRAQPYRWVGPGPHGRTIELADWFLPNLYQQGEDHTLVPATAGRPSSAPSDDRPYDVFLSHHHTDSAVVERLATELRDRYGLRVFFDMWETAAGPIHAQCREGIRNSRFVLIAVSRSSLASDWVNAELDIARALDPRGRNIIPLLFEEVDLPPDLAALRWFDFRDPQNPETLERLAATLGTRAAEVSQPARTRRDPATGVEIGAFPRPPLYQFQGRAFELYRLEQALRHHRAVLLHAMGGVGKTTLAREAAFWWTRTGLFPDGACFLSFERGGGADQIALVLGTYLEGAAFAALPAEQQLDRARQLFDQRRVLMVWDNFESVLEAFQEGEPAPLYSQEERGRIADLFRQWMESAGGHGRLLITCRPEEAGLLGARRMEIGGLARPDSLQMLAQVLAVHGVELSDPRLSREGLEELLEMLGDHPLSIELVGPHLKKMTPTEIVADFGQLLAGFTGDAEVARNRSLLASLEFSTGRLSEEARAALPWLALFRGGVFEHNLLNMSGLDPERWEVARGELEGTALVRVEREFLLADLPYLRFHPTLPFGAAVLPDLDMGVARKRFVQVYVGFGEVVDQASRGPNPGGAIEIVAREEANFRTAVTWALAAGEYGAASEIGGTFKGFLEGTGRLRELNSWVAWLAAKVEKGGFTKAYAERERDAAWALFSQQSRESEAVQRLEALIVRLKGTMAFDPTFQLAAAQIILGRVFYFSGSAARAIPILEQAVRQWEELGERERAASTMSDREKVNLAAALGDLANALRGAGNLLQAEAAANRSIQIFRELGHQRNIAAGLAQLAEILTDQGRFGEAKERYLEVHEGARRARDKELEALSLEHLGRLASDQKLLAEATEYYKQALELFQGMQDERGIQRSYNLLGIVEMQAGRLAEARAWYERCSEVAEARGDRNILGSVAFHLGIVCEMEGEAAQARGDETAARQCFQEAVESVHQSLEVAQLLNQEPEATNSHNQLAHIYLLLGDLDQAEGHAEKAREIRERLGLKEVSHTYAVLAAIAHARGDNAQAAAWEQKGDAARAEQRRRAEGPSGPTAPSSFPGMA
jgi:tetratricopeptide (TPR) repeat protein